MPSPVPACFGAAVTPRAPIDFLLLLVVAGLLFVGLCGVLYAARRLRYFLYWTLALLCAVGWRVGLLVEQEGLSMVPKRLFGLLGYATGLAGLWHAALWGLGLLGYRERHRKGAELRAGATLAEAIVSGRVALAVLLVAAMADFLVNLLLGPKLRQILIAGVVVTVYGASAIWFSRRRMWPVNLLLIAILSLLMLVETARALATAEAFQLAVITRAGLEYGAFRDFVLLALLAGGMIVVLADEGSPGLRKAHEQLREVQGRAATPAVPAGAREPARSA